MPTRLGRLVASWLLVSVGVPLLVRAELGVAPFDVFNTGIVGHSGLSFGLVFVLSSFSCFVLGAILGAPPGPASWIGSFAIGPLINVSLATIPQVEALGVRIPMLIGGVLIIAIGICLVVSTDLGAGPTEVVMLGMIRHGMGVVPARWISDGVPIVIGTLLGGQLGVGTIAFLVAMGPLVKFGLGRLGYVPRGLIVA